MASPPHFTRRQALALGVGAVAAASPLNQSVALSPVNFRPERHGMSAFHDLKYAENFEQFAYVNPAAPKAGMFSQVPPNTAYNQNFNTFNSLNMFILKGDGAHGMDTTFDTLMARAQDEPDAMYGLVAKSVQMSDDGRFYRFTLREEARFHDGSPLTAKDVAFSIETLKKSGHPLISQSMLDVIRATAEDDTHVLVEFAPHRARDVPLLVAGLPIFSQAYYAQRPFDQTTQEAPLGSGPYKLKRFEGGRFIEFERVPDYWGKDLPVNKGQNNFDTLRYEYFRDRDIAFEGFKGRAYLFREEFTSRTWATGYTFPAIASGKVVREVLPDDTPSGAQGWFINLRREKFKDARLREALILCFDFEWTNANLMFGSYERTHSLFQNSDMMATGAPSLEELAVMEPFRAQLAPEVFGTPFTPPVSDGSGQDRVLLRRANDLLAAAGWELKNGARVNARGEVFHIEFLDFDPGLEPHTNAYISTLKRLGIRATIRRVDSAQYQARMNAFDFDMTVRRYSLGSTPGEGIKRMLGSHAASINGSNNIAGITSPAVDALLDKIVAASTRQELTILCRVLDRVVRAERAWVPQWFKGNHWLAVWDVFGHPDTKPRYGRGAPETWWWDAEKAKKILG
jgi:microcin C transport system substrate-binding protein